MTQQTTFSRREVERSFRKFRDIVNDLFSAKFQQWGDMFTHLMSHCETDPVMMVVTEPLKSDPRVDAKKWWDDAVASVSGMVGSGGYSLPTDDQERTALLYQVFLGVEHENFSIQRFNQSVYGHSKYQDMVNTFNHELVLKFTREVSYRLDEIATDNDGADTIPREAMIVFHHHDNSTNISGTVQGSNIATGSAQIKNATAQFNTPSDVAAEINAIKSLATEFSKTNQKTLVTALDFLASAAESNDAPVTEIAEAARTVSELSPSIRDRLNSVFVGTGTSMAGSVIFEGLKLFFGG